MSESVYLRFGYPPPPGTRSAVGPRGWYEKGVSAYHGAKLSDGSYLIKARGLGHWILPWLLGQDRPLLVVEGVEIGTAGSCGEPLLKAVKMVEEVPPTAEVRLEPPSLIVNVALDAWAVRRRRQGRSQGEAGEAREPAELGG